MLKIGQNYYTHSHKRTHTNIDMDIKVRKLGGKNNGIGKIMSYKQNVNHKIFVLCQYQIKARMKILGFKRNTELPVLYTGKRIMTHNDTEVNSPRKCNNPKQTRT